MAGMEVSDLPTRGFGERPRRPSAGGEESTWKPGDFPLLSNRSRAAARAMLESRKKAEQQQEIVFVTRSMVDGSELDRGEPLNRKKGYGFQHRVIVVL